MQPPTIGFPLSLQQKHLWSFYPEASALISQFAVILDGPLDLQRLKKFLHAIVDRHEILRTTFTRSSGMKFPFQVVRESMAPTWEHLDLRSCDVSTQTDRVDELFRVPIAIDLERGPVLHPCLARLANDRHILMLRAPTLCADAASLRNVVLELSQLYHDSGAGLPNALQYADYSEWQSELIQKNDERAATGSDYWSQQGALPVCRQAVPFAHKPERDFPFMPVRLRVPLDDGVSKQLRSPGWDYPEAVFLSAWQILLSRLTLQPQVLIGYVTSGRNHEELDGAVGLFARALPLHASLEDAGCFRDFAMHVQQAKEEVEEWQDYFAPQVLTYEDLPVSFTVEERMTRRTAGGLCFSTYRECCYPNQFHVQLRALVEDGSWSAELVYDPSYFWSDGAERIAHSLAVLLAAGVTNPGLQVKDLPILVDSERQRTVVTFNKTAAPYPHERCIHQLFEEQAARMPQRPALRHGDLEFTYGQLNGRANQVAHFLRRHGVTANVAVGLCTERSAEMIIGLLGILKAGGFYVPLAPEYPKVRLARQLSETGANVILTQEKLLGAFREITGEIVCLDRNREVFDQESIGDLTPNTTAGDLVYVIYTSGSTGNPKGVAVRHSSLVNYSHFISRLLQLEKHESGLNFATVSTISADLGNTCIFPALISGGCLHVIGYETAMDANAFSDYVETHPVDVLKITPSHLNTLLSAGKGKSVLPRHHLLLGGEVLSWELLGRIPKTVACSIINHYGPTEATVGCCTFSVDDTDVSAWAPATVPIGRPIANSEVYIVDERLRPQPVGVAGELCIGGVGLARDYFNQPEQTAERFIPHPFSKDPSDRVYRTGDLARYLPDGNVEFLGRMDHQVKIRGFRVEPAEVEAVLKQHPAVEQTVIVSAEDRLGDKHLVAYVVSTARLNTPELRAFLLQRLPDYMIPLEFVVLDAFPLTRNGKLDLQALSLAERHTKALHEVVTPRSPEEEKLADIWTEVLRRDSVDVNSNFFELGGHSLLATQIVSRIREAFRVELPLYSFLETPTIAELAVKIRQSPQVESGEGAMARLLQELEALSDEEAEQLLAAELEREEHGQDSANR
jgi:amino acid adenylation domain-containing protein